MHPKNPYNTRYDLEALAKKHAALQKHIVLNPNGEQTINFNDASAVFELNKAMLLTHFDLSDYELPIGYLIPPIPGRLDYLLHLQDFLTEQLKLPATTKIRGLDIGAGANAIYCILGAQHFDWNMVGAECDPQATAIAKANMHYAKRLEDKVEIRQQSDKSFLFKGIIKPDENFEFTVCNPPFHSSQQEAVKGSLRKVKNLGAANESNPNWLNFNGQAGELWCNGGEALFVKRLIKESLLFKNQVKVFSSLVSKADNLPKIEKQLTKAKANYRIVPMEQGNKKSRFVAWWFD